jgi:hypothetical protein
VFFLLSLASCSTYQYVSVTTTEQSQRSGGVVFENDSVKVSHFFTGFQGPSTVEIHNKLNTPITINWEQSALVLDAQTAPEIRENTMSLNNSNAERIQWRRMVYDSVNRRHIDQPFTIISPQSAIVSDPIYLTSKFLKSYERKIKTDVRGDSLSHDTYTAAKSPLKFRSYISISSANDTIAIDQTFWVDDILTTRLKPRNMGAYATRQNVFFVTQTSKSGEKGGVIAILGAVAVLTVWAISSDF